MNNLNFSWTASSNFSDSIKEKLSAMIDQMRLNRHCLYQPLYEGVSLDFSKENSYYEKGYYPNKYYRTLAFFRYWNVIDYFFAYKHIMDQDWDTTFNQFVLQVINAENREAYHLNFKEFTTFIDDSHSIFDSPIYRAWRGNEFAPFKISYIDKKTIITKIAEENTGLNIGDIILAIDATPIDDLRNSLRKYAIASNEPTTQRNINYYLIYGKTQFTIKVEKSNGQEITIYDLKRSRGYLNFHVSSSDKLHWKTIKTHNCGDVGYVNMGLLLPDSIPSLAADLWDKETIIFDVRNYPNGALFELVKYLFNEPIHIADFTVPNQDYAGQFYWDSAVIGSNNTNNIFKGQLIILFNEETQSHAEYTVMGLEQHPNAIKIGSQTAAADGNISTIPLPGLMSVIFTGLGVYYPDGTPTQRIGIVPDFEVIPTIEGIRNGLDEVLEFALDCQKIEELTDIKEATTVESLSVYPNPAQNFINIKLQEDRPVDVIMYSITGSVVFNKRLSNNLTLDCSEYANGYYIITWKNKASNHFNTQKLLIQQ